MSKSKTTKADFKIVLGQLVGAMADLDYLQRALHNAKISLGHDFLDLHGVSVSFDILQWMLQDTWLEVDWLLRRIRAERPQ